MLNQRIKVLIADCSVLITGLLKELISKDPQIEVVAKVREPFEAMNMILKHRPDMIICDLEIPKMNGIELVKRLMSFYSIPVIVVSSTPNDIFDVLDMGAVDFLIKPKNKSSDKLREFADCLVNSIKAVVNANEKNSTKRFSKNEDIKLDKKDIIAIGASTGGTETIYKILKGLSADIPGIVVVQHIPPVFSGMFAERMNNQTEFTVTEAKGNEVIEPGRVFIAPGDKHLMVKRVDGKYITELYSGSKVSGHCPSVDVLFNSVANVCGKNAIGVILTGMGKDGAKGLLHMKQKGAITIGQDEKSSVVYGMPKVAFEIGAVGKQYNIESIPSAIINALKKKESRA